MTTESATLKNKVQINANKFGQNLTQKVSIRAYFSSKIILTNKFIAKMSDSPACTNLQGFRR